MDRKLFDVNLDLESIQSADQGYGQYFNFFSMSHPDCFVFLSCKDWLYDPAAFTTCIEFPMFFLHHS
jgi:hypothetical protein